MFSFSGKERDLETGYSYFGVRYYDAGTSIWLSVDPMAHKYPSMSPYAYCGNNPLRYIDPDGRMAVDHIDVEKNKDGTYTVVGGQATIPQKYFVNPKR